MLTLINYFSLNYIPLTKFFIILHNVRSRYNVGSVFRTADGAGVTKIYLGGITPAPPHEKISKVALGAENSVPHETYAQTWRLIEKLKKQGVQIIAVEQSNKSMPYYKFKPRFPLAVIMGSETKGLSPSILKRCDSIIEIPMHGKKESLNVATACGITCFELAKYL
ncbi:MAG: RNA methyltransferase [Patescibacteria group bacterium]|jgi:tRNA G18 (ribose-2'-O)-methylase SpoU